uniref:NADH dehydrogenase [ubiquinone] 1 alpha subcomplex subunit 11 n=1 Tax=Sphenodon punctatus TaxID=8508 RepID=A0A8D0H289_SPHPU
MLSYWDIPNGTACTSKAFVCGRLGAILGMIGSAYHIVLLPPGSALVAAQRAAMGTVGMGSTFSEQEKNRGTSAHESLPGEEAEKPLPPLFLICCCHLLESRARSTASHTATLGAVFGLTICVSAKIRDKPDDLLNYFLGGCASGMLLGARAHSAQVGCASCLGLGVTAALLKAGNLEGWRYGGPPEL